MHMGDDDPAYVVGLDPRSHELREEALARFLFRGERPEMDRRLAFDGGRKPGIEKDKPLCGVADQERWGIESNAGRRAFHARGDVAAQGDLAGVEDLDAEPIGLLSDDDLGGERSGD